MAQTLTRLLVHVIFSTKNRENLIPEPIESDLFGYIGGICKNMHSPLLAAGGTANHVHLLVSQSKTVTVADLLMHIKKDSSAWLNRQSLNTGHFGWQDGYGAFTIGESQIETARNYLSRQKEHHRKVSFEKEFVEFLRKYNIPYDERYVWT